MFLLGVLLVGVALVQAFEGDGRKWRRPAAWSGELKRCADREGQVSGKG